MRYGGRLFYFYNKWKTVTTSNTVLKWILGYKIPFIRPPVCHVRRTSLSTFIGNSSTEVSIKLLELLQIGAVVRCKHRKDEFISTFFLISKINGSSRFILNLRQLNKYIEVPHFKLEDFRSVRQLLQPGYFMTKIDLKDAYFMIQVHKSSRKYLRFLYGGELFEFTCLPMGLCTAPFVFTKMLKPVISQLRLSGIICVICLDDLLIMAKDKSLCLQHTKRALDLFSSLGFVINFNKSVLHPTISCQFLGFLFNSGGMTMSLPEKKVIALCGACSDFLKRDSCSIRSFAQLVGRLTAACPAFKYGWAHTKLFERAKLKALLKTGNMSLFGSIKVELNWWLTNLPNSSVSLLPRKFLIEVFSDASNVGWGGSCGPHRIHGLWDEEQICHHINYLELLAAFKCLQHFTQQLQHVDVLLRVDNTTAISYINRMGGVKYRSLNSIAQKIWNYCESKDIFIFASYINSKENVIADYESRRGYIETEYELAQYCFNKVCLHFFKPSVDLFASSNNAKCEMFASWKPDPNAFVLDAFTISWANIKFYAFPPFSMVSKVLNKVAHDRAEGLIIVPKWPGQPWYPVFMSLLVKKPLFFGPDIKMVLSPDRNPHPLWRSLILVVGHISGKHINVDPFPQ